MEEERKKKPGDSRPSIRNLHRFWTADDKKGGQAGKAAIYRGEGPLGSNIP